MSVPVSIVLASVKFDTIRQMILGPLLLIMICTAHLYILWRASAHNVRPHRGGNVEFDEANAAPIACAPTAFLVSYRSESRGARKACSIIAESVVPIMCWMMTVHKSTGSGGQGKAVERGCNVWAS